MRTAKPPKLRRCPFKPFDMNELSREDQELLKSIMKQAREDFRKEDVDGA
jgi:hypothetical protein